MKGFAKLIVVENEGGFAVVEDVFLGQVIAKVCCTRRTKKQDKEIAERIAAALNDDGEDAGVDMSDHELQDLINKVLNLELSVHDLSDGQFITLLGGLSRVFNARIFNCVDATGKKDNEWNALAEVFLRAKSSLSRKASTR